MSLLGEYIGFISVSINRTSKLKKIMFTETHARFSDRPNKPRKLRKYMERNQLEEIAKIRAAVRYLGEKDVNPTVDTCMDLVEPYEIALMLHDDE